LSEEQRCARTGRGAEDAEGNQPPEASAEVDRDGAAGVVDEQLEFEGLDEEGYECAGDDADEDGGYG